MSFLRDSEEDIAAGLAVVAGVSTAVGTALLVANELIALFVGGAAMIVALLASLWWMGAA